MIQEKLDRINELARLAKLRELSAEELFEIYKLRVSVFVVEQKCPYQEMDDADRTAYHRSADLCPRTV